MTPTAWRRGSVNGLICGVIFFGFWLLVAELISLITHRPRAESWWIAFAVLWGLLFLLFLGTLAYGLRTGGRVLLDCGPHPTRALFLLNAALFPIMGLTMSFSPGTLSESIPFVGPVFGVTFGVYWLIMATGRLQIREGGLWQYWALLRWYKIESLRWSGDSTLLVKAKSRLPFLGRGALPVPPEQKQAINELLQKYCPVWDPEF
jgi:hypothetical protein